MSFIIRFWNCSNSVINIYFFYFTGTGKIMNSNFDVLPSLIYIKTGKFQDLAT